jgi:hypothetical protein
MRKNWLDANLIVVAYVIAGDSHFGCMMSPTLFIDQIMSLSR